MLPYRVVEGDATVGTRRAAAIHRQRLSTELRPYQQPRWETTVGLRELSQPHTYTHTHGGCGDLASDSEIQGAVATSLKFCRCGWVVQYRAEAQYYAEPES